jgi:uncharacterized Zn-finger protein
MSALAIDHISIGCQGGGPDTGKIGHEKVYLYRMLKKHVKSTYCSAIDHYGLVLRVDGALQRFGDEGLARLRFAKKNRYITVDIQIPESVWRPLSFMETKHYLASQVRAALVTCVNRLKADKHAVGESELFEQVDAAISEYLFESSPRKQLGGQV